MTLLWDILSSIIGSAMSSVSLTFYNASSAVLKGNPQILCYICHRMPYILLVPLFMLQNGKDFDCQMMVV